MAALRNEQEKPSRAIWVKDALVELHNSGEIVLPADIDALEASAVKLGFQWAPHAEQGEGATVINDAF